MKKLMTNVFLLSVQDPPPPTGFGGGDTNIDATPIDIYLFIAMMIGVLFAIFKLYGPKKKS